MHLDLVSGAVPAADPSSPEGQLVVLSGPSGAGKSTVVRALMRRRPMHFSVSLTTRSPRPHEQEGVHYLFVTPAEFKRMAAAGELLESAEYAGRLYGTPRGPVLEALADGKDVLLEIEVQGAAQVKRAIPEAVTIFVVPPSVAELERRLRSRGDTSDIERRLEIAQQEINMAAKMFDHIVVNRSVNEAVNEIDRILGKA